MKSFMAKNNEVEQKWLLVDADGLVLGRMAAELAPILMGFVFGAYYNCCGTIACR